MSVFVSFLGKISAKEVLKLDNDARLCYTKILRKFFESPCSVIQSAKKSRSTLKHYIS